MSFDLYKMGWNDFQKLCGTILKVVLGQTTMTFAKTNDAGMDALFQGTWSTSEGEASGLTIVQCKHKSNLSTLTPSEVADELPKIKKLVKDGKLDNYILMTNAGVTGNTETKLRTQLTKLGVKKFAVYGKSWFDETLFSNRRVRTLVPRLYGLGDLSQILDERAYAQAGAVLEYMRADLSKVVLTNPYLQAIQRLRQDGMVILVGEATAGKTTIASCLALACLDSSHSSVIKLDSISDFPAHWNPLEPTQVFWVDDIFGVTHYQPELAQYWDAHLPKTKAAVNRGGKLILTSRDYIYNQSLEDLKRRERYWLTEKELVIDVKELTEDEKKQITYNHLKLGEQPRAFLTEIKPYLDEFSCHPNFLPETARRLGSPRFTKSMEISEWSVHNFVSKPQELLEEIISELEESLRVALLLMYLHGGELRDPIPDSSRTRDFLGLIDSSLNECSSSLMALRGSLVINVNTETGAQWSFKHPTIRDALRNIVKGSDRLISLFVAHAPLAHLCSEITLGGAWSRGSLLIETSHQPLLVERLLKGLEQEPNLVLSFLSSSANSKLVIEHSTLAQMVGKCIEYSHPGLLLKLFRAGALPEFKRASYVAQMSSNAIDFFDHDVYTRSGMREMFSTEENEILVSKMEVKIKDDDLAPDIEAWLDSYEDAHGDPTDFANPIIEALEALEAEYPDDEEIQDSLTKVNGNVEDWLSYTQERYSELYDEVHEPLDFPSQTGFGESSSSAELSVFDDIDE